MAAFAHLPTTTATPAVELLMDVANASEEITSRITARAFAAVAHPEQGPALREVLAELGRQGNRAAEPCLKNRCKQKT